MNEKTIDKRDTAYHEAGHAVVHIHHGILIKSVSIEGQDDYHGSVSHPSPMMFNCSGRRERRRVAREMIIGCFAGFEAEKRFNPQAPEFHGESDEADVINLCREYGVFPRECRVVGDEAHRRYLDGLRKKARRLVRELWPEIDDLAKALLERETLTGEEAAEIVTPF